tara:strand:+ start:34830 stop:35600 length:771 start_codon:yes stop_codon:yes gene_type:complete
MDVTVIHSLLSFVIVLITVTISLSALSLHEGMITSLSVKNLILSKARLVLKELNESQRLNIAVHLQALLGFILTASIIGEAGHNLNLIIVGILLMSNLSYQLLTRAEEIEQSTFFHGLIEVAIIIVLLAIMKTSAGWAQLVLGLVTYLVVSTLSFRNTSLSPWQEKRQGYIIEVLSAEIVRYWIVGVVVLNFIHVSSGVLNLMIIGSIHILATLIVNPVIRGSMAKRSTQSTFVQKITVILIGVACYTGFSIWSQM